MSDFHNNNNGNSNNSNSNNSNSNCDRDFSAIFAKVPQFMLLNVFVDGPNKLYDQYVSHVVEHNAKMVSPTNLYVDAGFDLLSPNAIVVQVERTASCTPIYIDFKLKCSAQVLSAEKPKWDWNECGRNGVPWGNEAMSDGDCSGGGGCGGCDGRGSGRGSGCGDVEDGVPKSCDKSCRRDVSCAYSQFNTGFYMYPRSSLSKTPLRLANCVGIIDSGYRGNIIGKFDNFGALECEFNINQFDRLVQICAPSLMPIYVKLVDNLDDLGASLRGSGGFGSSGR